METSNKGLAGSNEIGIIIKTSSQKKLSEVLPVMYELITETDSKGNLINAYYKELEYDTSKLITKFKVHTSINIKDKNFNILDTIIAFIEELEFKMPENVRSIRFNRETTKNELGISKIEYFDTSSLLSAKNMFAGCWDLESINFTSTTENILDMDGMFSMCGKLTSVPNNLNTSACLTMNRMFDYCVKLTSIPEDFDTSNCTSMQATFRGCRELISLPVLNTSNVRNFKECFAYCQSLDTIPDLDMTSARNMKYMFLSCKNITEIKDFKTPNLEILEGIFKGCSLLGSVGEFYTSKVKYFNDVFNGCTMLNTPPSWDTSSALSMARMFKNCENLLTMPAYNMTNVTDVEEMFYNCSSIITDFKEKFDTIILEREPEVITKIEIVESEEIVVRKDENGKEILDENGNKIYDTIIVKKEQEVSEVIWHEKIKLDITEASNCIDRKQWWQNYLDVPEKEPINGVLTETGNIVKKGKFNKFKDCFTGCGFYNQKGILENWYKEYPDTKTGTVYIYKVNYKTTSTTIYNDVVHKFIKVETIEDIKRMQEQLKELLGVIEVNIVSLEVLETYLLPVKGSEE